MGAVARRWVPIVVGVVAVAVLVSACGPATKPASHGSGSHASSSSSAQSDRPFSLYTHCGVREARIGNTFYAADHPLDDGQGNPPPGWGNPYQKGRITLPTPSTAVFRDGLGHVVRFHAEPGAASSSQICS